MKFIFKTKLKLYTKESIKYLIIGGVAFGIIGGTLLLKYKPLYEVKIGGEQVGYIENIENFEQEIQNKIVNYTSQNVDSIKIKENPVYELKLVDREQTTNEQDIIIAMQKDLEITYKYFEIALNDEIIEKVNNKEEAENLINEMKEKDSTLNLTIEEKTTDNLEEIEIASIDAVREKLNDKIKDASAIADIEGIKVAVNPVQGIISSRYGVSSRIRSSAHTGLDIAASTGTQIKAVADGTVTNAKYSGAYGNLVKISHGNGIETWYAHASKIYVKQGQEVKAGDVIAAVGSTGNSTGPHLHFEIRINGNHVNPQKYMYN